MVRSDPSTVLLDASTWTGIATCFLSMLREVGRYAQKTWSSAVQTVAAIDVQNGQFGLQFLANRQA